MNLTRTMEGNFKLQPWREKVGWDLLLCCEILGVFFETGFDDRTMSTEDVSVASSLSNAVLIRIQCHFPFGSRRAAALAFQQ